MDKELKGVLFDFDGTLVYLGVDWNLVRRQLASLAKQFGVDFNEASVLQSIHDGHSYLLRNSKTKRLADKFLQKAYQIMMQAELAGLDKTTLVPGAREVLEWLAKDNIATAVLSNNDSSCVRMAFAKFGLPNPSVIVGRDTVSSPKPSTEGAEFALGTLGLTPGECWLVGDSSPDVEVGKALGLKVILIHPTTSDNGQNETGVSVISNITHIKNLLQSKTNS